MWSKYASVVEPLPPGYRFAPTDEELMFYLRNKVSIRPVPIDAVKDIGVDELYGYPPYDIVEDPRGEIGEWYFFIYHGNCRDNIPMAGKWPSYWKKEAFEQRNENGYEIFGKELEVEGQEKDKIRVVGNGIGFWKSVGKEDPIYDDSRNVFAFKIHFIYFSGSTKKAKKTHWRMEEYHLLASAKRGKEQDLKKEEWVLGRITRGRDYS